MAGETFELSLIRSPEDEPTQSSVYQAELRTFALMARSVAPRVQQTAFTMDSFDGGSYSLGEFIFTNAKELISAFENLGLAYIAYRAGRKVKMVLNGLELQAENAAEIEQIAEMAKRLTPSTATALSTPPMPPPKASDEPPPPAT